MVKLEEFKTYIFAFEEDEIMSIIYALTNCGYKELAQELIDELNDEDEE